MIRFIAIPVGPPGRGRARAGEWGAKAMPANVEGASTPKFQTPKGTFSRNHIAGSLVLERAGQLNACQRGTASDLGASGRKN
jgi:hypothetical protein